MTTRMLRAADVRHMIATFALGEVCVPEKLGDVTLHPHQRSAAARALERIASDRGVLVAEPVGRGKTFIALAVAARLSEPLTLVIPAALRAMWSDALAASRLSATILTHETLSRGAADRCADGLVLVDEAHRFRNPATRRYAALAELCRRARVLLLTATPIQNRRDDLAAQVALFLGRRAWTMDGDALSAHVVRASGQDEASSPRLPRQQGPVVVPLAAVDDCLDQIVALAPPVPARDESIAHTLLIYGLVHQWTSSRAALVEALRRRRTRGLAMLAALEAGRAPTRSELSAWTHASEAVQLAFPELVVGAANVDVDTIALTTAIDRHLAGIDALLHHCRNTPDPDRARADALVRLRAEHPGERILAFAHYAETVNGLRRHLANVPHVATLTARGAVIAGGRMSRADVLAQFTPGHHAQIPAAERIDLLIATDLLSEGMNLQEASVAVHLDLPWNPARLEQRVGRIRRLGSRHARVMVYAFAPPASADSLLRMETRLRDKLRVAQRTVGVAGSILPSPLPSLASPASAEVRGELHAHLDRWRSDLDAPDRVPSGVVVAAVRSTVTGCIAAIGGDGAGRIVALRDGDTSDRPQDVVALLALADGDDAEPDRHLLDRCLRDLERFADHRRGASAIDLVSAAATRSRRAVLDRVALSLARAPRHRRAQIIGLADAARLAATASLAEGAERVLDLLVQSDLPDEAWLRSLAAFGELHRRDSGSTPIPRARPLAVLLLQSPGL